MNDLKEDSSVNRFGLILDQHFEFYIFASRIYDVVTRSRQRKKIKEGSGFPYKEYND
jgi:hypothetical protein